MTVRRSRRGQYGAGRCAGSNAGLTTSLAGVASRRMRAKGTTLLATTAGADVVDASPAAGAAVSRVATRSFRFWLPLISPTAVCRCPQVTPSERLCQPGTAGQASTERMPERGRHGITMTSPATREPAHTSSSPKERAGERKHAPRVLHHAGAPPAPDLEPDPEGGPGRHHPGGRARL